MGLAQQHVTGPPGVGSWPGKSATPGQKASRLTPMHPARPDYGATPSGLINQKSVVNLKQAWPRKPSGNPSLAMDAEILTKSVHHQRQCRQARLRRAHVIRKATRA